MMNKLIILLGFRIYQLIIMAVYGLKTSPTINGVIQVIVTEPDPITYPGSSATCVRHSFGISQLGGEGMRETEEQQERHMKGAATSHAIRNLARYRDDSHADVGSKQTL